MIYALQVIDAVLIGGIVGCLVIVMQRDFQDAPLITRVAMGIFGTMAVWQAAYLLGTWEPGPTGFPLSRIGFDGSILFVSVCRVIFPQRVGRLGHCR